MNKCLARTALPSGGGGCAAHRPPHQRKEKRIPSTCQTGSTATFNAACNCKLACTSKMARNMPKVPQKCSPDPPGSLQNRARGLPESQDPPKSCSRALQSSPRASKKTPKRGQETPKSAQKASKTRPGDAQTPSKSSPGSLQTQRSHALPGKFHLQSPGTYFLSVFRLSRSMCSMLKPSKNLGKSVVLAHPEFSRIACSRVPKNLAK